MNDDFKAELASWAAHVDPDDAPQLDALASDSAALKEAFYRELSFGTAGLRGIVGMGPNRMNVYTVGKATQGLADYLNAHFEHPNVAIARDSRHMGRAFVETAACVLAANGVEALVFSEIEPTPVLSFAVRHHGCSAGINVTASHNPATYNGYKVYGSDGCQISGQAAEEIQGAIDALDTFADVRRVSLDEARASGLIRYIGEGTVDAFLDAVAAQSVEPVGARDDDAALSIVYTPLNGTGLECVTRILERVGIGDVTVVAEQARPDGDFPTCPYPNPEFREALERGLALCEQVHPDLLIATDPDADRVGIAVRHDGGYALLTGNEVGVLLLDYLCSARVARGDDLSSKVAVTTVVSSLMPDAQARDHGFQLRRVLTGFKNIGGQIALLEQAGAIERFMFGYEESYGYMSGPHVRDKDAVNASMLIAQMARWHKRNGRDLVEAMDALYERYGYYLNRTISLEFAGSAGAEKMAALMERLREQPPVRLGGLPIAATVDFERPTELPYINQGSDATQQLPAANMVSFELGEGIKVLVRPSGTEPKIKAYLFSRGASRGQAEKLLDALEEDARRLLC